MKAFLSHSSKDKEFVKAVADELGRQSSVLDDRSFDTGVEFMQSIEASLDESSVFVLFASSSSLKSVWVDFEINEAWFRKLQKKLSTALVYLLEAGLTQDDLPEWLRRARVGRLIVPKAVARDIRRHLNEQLLARQDPYFVGRSRDLSALEQVLTPVDGRHPPRAAFITGLPGIGRRTLLRHALPGILNLRKQIEIRIGEGDSQNDICAKMADLIEPYSTQEGFASIINEILKLPPDAAAQRTLDNIASMIHAGEVPILVDEGGMLDEEGNIREPIEAILKRLAPNDERYIFFVSERRPKSSPGRELPVVQVHSLDPDDTKRLITRLAIPTGLKISDSELVRMAEYVAGYPPAAYFAVQEADRYGVAIIIKGRLVEFRQAIFLKHFAELSLSPDEKELLRLLAFYSPLPLGIIAHVVRLQETILSDIMIRLLDLSFVTTTKDGYYRIADPIADAASHSFGFPTQDVHRAVAQNLDELLKDSDLVGPRLELSRVLFRAASMAQQASIAERAVHLANDLIQLTESLYHQHTQSAFIEAIQTGLLALEQRPRSYKARSFVIRALIQLERYEQAESQIRILQSYTPLRDVRFLHGFLERRRGDIPAAIDAYQESERLGRKDASVSRELALCFFLKGSLDLAAKYISEALKNRNLSDNPYVVDLSAQIATRQKNEPAAREALKKLELIGGNKLYYYHRKSRIEFAFGKKQDALQAARMAVDYHESPPFEALAQLAYCEMESGHLKEADKVLTRLDQKFGKVRGDIRIGLRCRLAIARKHFADALAQLELTKTKNTIFYKKIRRDALQGEVSYSVLNDDVRSSYKEEIAKLDQELGEISVEQFLPADLAPDISA